MRLDIVTFDHDMRIILVFSSSWLVSVDSIKLLPYTSP